MVFSLSASSAAISLIVLPLATMRRTCSSRLERQSCGACWRSPLKAAASFSASEAVTYLPPDSAFFAAARNIDIQEHQVPFPVSDHFQRGRGVAGFPDFQLGELVGKDFFKPPPDRFVVINDQHSNHAVLLSEQTFR